MSSVGAVLWKERREAAVRLRGAARVAVIGAAAVAAAWARCAPWEVRAAAGLFALPALVAVTWVGDSFVAERERRTLEPLLATPLSPAAVYLGKVLTAALLSWGFGALVLVAASGGAAELSRAARWGPASLLAVLAAAQVAALASCRAHTPAEAQGRAVLLGVAAAGAAWAVARVAGPAHVLGGASPLRGVDPHLVVTASLAAVDGLLAALGIALFAGRRARRGGPS